MVAAVVAAVGVVAAPVVSGTVAVAVAVVAVAVAVAACVRRPETVSAMVTLSIYQAWILSFQTRPTT